MTDTVLYVEDNENNVRLVERMLRRRANVDLVIAINGHQGLRLAQDTAPRLILLDRRLPDMLGNDVLRQLKASAVTAKIPVVMVSGDSREGQATEILRLGADEFLPKPFDVNQFLTVIDRFCG
jgi:CheY-like chemotaxis protein